MLVEQGILKTLGLYRATMTNTHGKFLFFNFLVFRKPMLNRVAQTGSVFTPLHYFVTRARKVATTTAVPSP